MRNLAAIAIARVTAGVGAASQSPAVREFWDGTSLPFAEKNLRLSPVES